MRWLDRMPRDDIVGEQVLEPPPPHRDAVECGRGTRGSNAPEHRRKCNVASQDGTRNSECALRNLATRMPQADWLSRKGMIQGTPGNYKRCHWRGAARLARCDTDVSHATRVQNGWGKCLVPLVVQIRSPHITHTNATCTHNGPGRERSTYWTECCSCPAGVCPAWLYDAAKDWKPIRCSTCGQAISILSEQG